MASPYYPIIKAQWYQQQSYKLKLFMKKFCFKTYFFIAYIIK